MDDDDEAAKTSEPDLVSNLSFKAQYNHDNDMDLHVVEFPDIVEQRGWVHPAYPFLFQRSTGPVITIYQTPAR